MIKKNDIIALFQQMWKENWSYTWGGASKGNVDCSGAFVYAYKVLDAQKIAIHGSNYIARQECGAMLPISQAQPGMAAFKKREPSNSKYALPGRYKSGGAYYNGDLNDYYHIGLVDTDTGYVLNAQSTSTGFVRSPISQNWCGVAYLNKVSYEGSVDPMEVLYTATVGNLKEGTTKLNVRETPSASGKKVGTLTAGDTVNVYEDADGWAKIDPGYVMSKFLIKQEGDIDADDSTVDSDGVADTDGDTDPEVTVTDDAVVERLDSIIALLSAIYAKMDGNSEDDEEVLDPTEEAHG